MASKKSPRFRPLRLPGFVVLGFMCFIFYAALQYYSGSALALVQSPGALGRVVLLRGAFSVFFCALLGIVGVKITGRLWPAPLVHMLAAACMLLFDMPYEQLLQDLDVTAALIGGVGLVTALAGAGAHFAGWLGKR